MIESLISILQQYLPNVVKYSEQIKQATIETLSMVFLSGIYSIVIGVPLGILLYTLGKDQILENKFIYSIFSKVINIVRSIPFVILVSAIPWVIRAIGGSLYSISGASVALAIGCIPFMARQVELALLSVNKGTIEAYEAIGFNAFNIIVYVILKEALPNIVQAITLTLISLVGFSAIAGTIGAGGLGSFAIQYGYNEFKDDIMLVTVILILIIVFGIQFIGDLLYKTLAHKK